MRMETSLFRSKIQEVFQGDFTIKVCKAAWKCENDFSAWNYLCLELPKYRWQDTKYSINIISRENILFAPSRFVWNWVQLCRQVHGI